MIDGSPARAGIDPEQPKGMAESSLSARPPPCNNEWSQNMTNKQKIQRRVSEIKQRLDIISGYKGDGPPEAFFDNQPPEVVALTAELKDLEWQLAAPSSIVTA